MTWNVLKILASAAEYGLTLACRAAMGDTILLQFFDLRGQDLIYRDI
jgi:hypothetical protein